MYSVVLLALLGSAPPAVEVQTLTGETVAGRVLQLDGQHVAVDRDGTRVAVPTETVLAVSPVSAPSRRVWEPGVWVDLADGTSLVAVDYAAQKGRANITLTGQQSVELPARDVVAVRFGPASEAVLAEWARIRETGDRSDLLVVPKDNTVDFHRGVLGDVTGGVVQFRIEGELLPVKREKVLGVVCFEPEGRQLPEALCRVTDADGSCWAVRTIKLAADGLQWTTPLGLNITRPWTAIVRLDFSQGKVVYLSRLQPESRQWTPYFSAGKPLAAAVEFFAPKEDQALGGGAIELGGTSYAKGLALHSRARLVYRLPDAFRRFKAVAGIDDRVRPRGNARLVIEADGRILLETVLRGTDPPKPIDLDLAGAQRLVVLVDFGDEMDVSDHVDLADARVLK